MQLEPVTGEGAVLSYRLPLAGNDTEYRVGDVFVWNDKPQCFKLISCPQTRFEHQPSGSDQALSEMEVFVQGDRLAAI